MAKKKRRVPTVSWDQPESSVANTLTSRGPLPYLFTAIAALVLVALGLVAECALASDLGLVGPDLAERVAALLARFDLPVHLTADIEFDQVLRAMTYDKKAAGGAQRFALPTGLGTMAGSGDEWTVVAETSRIRKALASLSTD